MHHFHVAWRRRGTAASRASLSCQYLAVCQNLVPLVNIKIAGKWMFIPLKMILIGIDPYPFAALGDFRATVSVSCYHIVTSESSCRILPCA